MSDQRIDILMITHNRPEYTRRTLMRLLESCDRTMSVWLWHNGEHPHTLAVTRELAEHPRVARFRHSRENVELREPTNWLYSESTAPYVAKVDDDCLVPLGWAQTLRAAHESCQRLGIVACWHFQDSDYLPEIAQRKVRELGEGHRIMLNAWVGGSAYLLKRAAIVEQGPLRENESFTHYCIRLYRADWLVGWYFPFIRQAHLDDPRAPETLVRDDSDFKTSAPLSARNFNVPSLEAWDQRLRTSARIVQTAPADPACYAPWRCTARRYWRAVARRVGLPAPQW